MFGVVTVIFFLFNILPGDPAQMMLGQNQNSAQLDVVKKKYGFDKPLSCLLYTSPSPRDMRRSRMPSSA